MPDVPQMLPVLGCDTREEPHDHLDCLRALWLAEHDHDACGDLLMELRPSQRVCNISEDDSHNRATHARRGLTGGVIASCEPCFIDVNGPHDCLSIDCPQKPWPCPSAGMTPLMEQYRRKAPGRFLVDARGSKLGGSQ